MKRAQVLKLARGLRWIATSLLMLAVFRETGIWTTVTVLLLVLSFEAQTYDAESTRNEMLEAISIYLGKLDSKGNA